MVVVVVMVPRTAKAAMVEARTSEAAMVEAAVMEAAGARTSHDQSRHRRDGKRKHYFLVHVFTFLSAGCANTRLGGLRLTV
jgi:hypothetical protein